MLKIISRDSYLKPYSAILEKRHSKVLDLQKKITGGRPLSAYACSHLYYGMHRNENSYIFREWAPNATAVYLLSGSSGWDRSERYRFSRIPETGDWQLECSCDEIRHGDLYKLYVEWPGCGGERIPSHAVRVVQDSVTKIFTAQVWDPKEKYEWKHNLPAGPEGFGMPPVVYEAHVGMAQEEEKTGTFDEFREKVLPHIAKSGYNTIQFMALMEHPYYGSFGYQVSNFFALSSRFGTPEQFRHLVDECHRKGIRVIMDIVHSHSVKNENEGLSRFDGTDYQYFHAGNRGLHPAWDSRLFDYGKDKVLHFLLSNCAYWLTEYNLDGFRFDGVTSMLYHDHGLGKCFSSYNDYFNSNFDDDAAAYLALANILIHEIKPSAITISEDMSGYPGMAEKICDGGLGFDYRLAMGVPDFWIKTLKEKKDEQWSAGEIWFQLGNRRKAEKNIAYCESHDQALVGDKTLAFRLMDAEMYHSMALGNTNLVVDRGIALHKIIRLLTFSLGGEGYLNFMGNEFGHPEWIDFPREGNGWSYRYARRQWSLLENRALRYFCLAEFDRAMIGKCAPVLGSPHAEQAVIDEHGQVLSYKRGGLLFAVNFNPSVSHTDYPIETEKGKYRLILDTDSPLFNGFGRIPASLVIDTVNTGSGNTKRDAITPYLPARSALVFERKER